MGRFRYKRKRYSVQAKRKDEKKWTEWTLVDSFDDAVKHASHVEELGYCSRIIDRGEDNGLEQIH